MSKTKTPTMNPVQVLVTVKAPKRLSPDKVANLIEQCIDIGMNDASESSDDPGIDNPDAEDCVALIVKSVKAQPPKANLERIAAEALRGIDRDDMTRVERGIADALVKAKRGHWCTKFGVTTFEATK